MLPPWTLVVAGLTAPFTLSSFNASDVKGETRGRRLAQSPERMTVEYALKLQPRAFAASCKHYEAILKGTKEPMEPISIPAYAALTTTAAKVAYLKTLPFLGKKVCAQLANGKCKDDANYQFYGYPCSDWGMDYNEDGRPDCSLSDVGYIHTCTGKLPSNGQLADVPTTGVGFQCEVGGWFDTSYSPAGTADYYPRDITRKDSPNYNVPAGQVGGMDQLRVRCPAACHFDEHCILGDKATLG